uniref:Uncharacterized protein n=1 Tax=viral metagenome TaxID=1070528 RepID=A0A6M3M2A8_9ZZZZ
MEVRKSIVLSVDSDVWAEFRMKAIAEDISVGGLVRRWIEEWVEENKEED